MTAGGWVRRVLVFGGMVLLAGCAQKGLPPLYMWEAFPRLQYEALQRAGASPVEQIGVLEAHAEKARGDGAALPPGFRAHLGMLKLSVGDVDRARQLWQSEKTVFPESAPYMDRLLKQLQVAPKTENPA